jgi:hypothetical protein
LQKADHKSRVLYHYHIIPGRPQAEIDLGGFEVLAIFSREISIGETIRVDFHNRSGGGLDSLSLLVTDKEADRLYVIREQTPHPNDVCICEVITAKNRPQGPKESAWTPIGCISLRRRRAANTSSLSAP